MARKLFGRRNATMNASDAGPAPSTAAMTTSRTNPATRESAVKPPTEARRPIMGPFYGKGIFRSVYVRAPESAAGRSGPVACRLGGRSFLRWGSRAARPRLLDETLGKRSDLLYDRLDAGGIGMDAVGLHQRTLQHDAFEKEGIEQRFIF